MGNATFLNLKLNADEWKWNWYGTFFHPAAERFFWSQGCFCGAGLSCSSSPVQAAGGIWSMVMREMEFASCLQFALSFLLRSDCFVCLFSILVAGNSYGETDYRILGCVSVRSSLYLSQILWLRRWWILDLSFQNSLSARQRSHYFNILDIYYFLTFTVVQAASWRWWEGKSVTENTLPEIPKENHNPIILNNLLESALKKRALWVRVFSDSFPCIRRAFTETANESRIRLEKWGMRERLVFTFLRKKKKGTTLSPNLINN